MACLKMIAATVGVVGVAVFSIGLCGYLSFAAQAEDQQFVLTPWKKFCIRHSSEADKKTCFTGIAARKPSGLPLTDFTVVESDDNPNIMTLRVEVPLGVDLKQGVDIVFDQGEVQRLEYAACYPRGCLAVLQTDSIVLSRLKTTQQIRLRAPKMAASGQLFEMTIPVGDFAAVHDAPYDFKAVEEAELADRKAYDEQRRIWGERAASRLSPAQ